MAKRRATGATFIGKSRSVPSELKAYYHNIVGAGRSGVIREFLDVNEADTEALSKSLATLITARLKQTTS